jgi:uncharacterized membrane protein
MKTKLDRYDVISFVLLGAAVIAAAALYPGLPERFPIRFNVEGNANNWAPRVWGAFFLPAVGLGLWLLLRLGPNLLPKDWRERMQASPLSVAALLAVVFFAALQGFLLYSAAHPGEHRTALFGVIGGYFVLFGQVLPRIRRNPFIGIRTAFTLSSDENWLRTHRLAGYTLTVGGVAAFALSAVSGPAAVAAILASGLVPAVYSYVLARRLASN